MVWREQAGAPEMSYAGDGVRPSALPFVLLLVCTGILLTLMPEFVYLRDNFGMRLNTTFKFYYQAWVMFGVAAVFAIEAVWTAGDKRQRQLLPAATTVAYVALLCIALLFPVFAVRSRSIEFRGQGPDRQPPTLNGLAHIKRFQPAEYDAITWLRQNVRGTPVVLEAVGGQYSDFGRVSANTGLPTVLGWPGHEWQWRGSDHPEPGQRDTAVRTIYSATDLDEVAPLLNQYEVAYIYAGDLEANSYGSQGLEKFRQRLPVAYANDRVTISAGNQ
jgi:YYY domain-containing protein